MDDTNYKINKGDGEKMNIFFMRHGEAEDNINELLSSSPLRCSVLTKKGRRQVVDSANALGKIDKVYTSPLIRTLQTAKIITENQGNKISVIIDDRIREINWGRYDGQANNQDLDEVRTKQANGDYLSGLVTTAKTNLMSSPDWSIF